MGRLVLHSFSDGGSLLCGELFFWGHGTVDVLGRVQGSLICVRQNVPAASPRHKQSGSAQFVTAGPPADRCSKRGLCYAQ
jgi:hypothetical protein